jgi:hypothetical protein
MMCRERSKRAQFIMVTLRKVSLRLADHHIGITHGGDGCSRRIVDFDRERAIALGERALAEAEKDNEKNHSRIEEARAAEHEMPEVPEAMPAPQSLGGLLPHMTDQGESEPSLAALSERTAEMTEDIEAYQEVAQAVREVDQQDAIESEIEDEEELV